MEGGPLIGQCMVMIGKAWDSFFFFSFSYVNKNILNFLFSKSISRLLRVILNKYILKNIFVIFRVSRKNIFTSDIVV